MVWPEERVAVFPNDILMFVKKSEGKEIEECGLGEMKMVWEGKEGRREGKGEVAGRGEGAI